MNAVAIRKTVWSLTVRSLTRLRVLTTGLRLLYMFTIKALIRMTTLLFLRSAVTLMSSETKWRTILLSLVTVQPRRRLWTRLRALLLRALVIFTMYLLMIKISLQVLTYRFSGRNTECESRLANLEKELVVTCPTATLACSTPRSLWTLPAMVHPVLQVIMAMS